MKKLAPKIESDWKNCVSRMKDIIIREYLYNEMLRAGWNENSVFIFGSLKEVLLRGFHSGSSPQGFDFWAYIIKNNTCAYDECKHLDKSKW